jgi:quercetin dioxygenase-like cupin family protein
MGDSAIVTGNWYQGNAAEDDSERRGWFLGHFIDPADGVRSSKAVEVKWGIHSAGEKRPEWTADDQRSTLVLMVQGSFRIDLTEATVTLTRQGDYVVWGPGIDHTWEALSDSVVVTIRWPSSP